MRVKRGVHAAKKRRTTLERASGYRGQRSRLFHKGERASYPLNGLCLQRSQG